MGDRRHYADIVAPQETDQARAQRAGATLGWGVARVLVKLLTGVFDPPPDHLAVPWLYLLAVAFATTAAVVGASEIMTRLAGRSVLVMLRRV